MDTKTLITKVAERTGRNPEDVEVLVRALGTIIAERVREGDTVNIAAFGQFEPKMKHERIANHPSSGRKILVPPRLSMIFKPSALLKQRVRNS